MAYKVLVVDDSSFFRRRVTDILNKDPQLEVIDVAVNGQEAVDKALALKVDDHYGYRNACFKWH